MVMVVRFLARTSKLCWIQRSLSLSRALVASSKIRMGGFFKYQRRRELSPLSLDAARAAELGLSYGQYKAREVV